MLNVSFSRILKVMKDFERRVLVSQYEIQGVCVRKCRLVDLFYSDSVGSGSV
jgi:hypothetical protein